MLPLFFYKGNPLGQTTSLRYTKGMRKVTIKQLRFISLVEGISYVLLLGIGMPLKYGLGIREVNMVLGMTHGILTMIFCIVLGLIWIQKTLPAKWCIGVFIASLIPCGAFVADNQLKTIQPSQKINV